MRVLFTAVPAYGHVIPLLPLAEAARRAGHEVALLTHSSMASLTDRIRLIAAGPSTGDVRAELARREAMLSESMPMAERAKAVFVDVRIDLGVVLPGGRDKPDNAARVSARGAGRTPDR